MKTRKSETVLRKIDIEMLGATDKKQQFELDQRTAILNRLKKLSKPAPRERLTGEDGIVNHRLNYRLRQLVSTQVLERIYIGRKPYYLIVDQSRLNTDKSVRKVAASAPDVLSPKFTGATASTINSAMNDSKDLIEAVEQIENSRSRSSKRTRARPKSL